MTDDMKQILDEIYDIDIAKFSFGKKEIRIWKDITNLTFERLSPIEETFQNI